MISSNENIKTFVLDNEDTKQSKIIEYNIPANSPTISVKFLLENVYSPQTKQFTIYSAETDTFVPFEEICIEPFIIPKYLLELQIIMIKYHETQDKLNDESHDTKKQRSKQRTIGQVLEVVHHWRSLHENNQNKKKVNLQEAANIVGISKKSLDDYYYQLRVGQKLQFDFNSHLNDKIGVLRAFIKENQPFRKTKQKPAKHPKKLKIIQDFAQSLHLKDPEMIEVEVKQNKIEQVNPVFGEPGLFWGPDAQSISRQSLIDCQNDFFKGFKFQIQEQNDPFLLFNQRKISDFENSSQNIFNGF